MDLLVEAHDEFIKLPQNHPDEVLEWRLSFHGLQHVLIHRVVCRDYPDNFYSELNK